MRLDALCIGNHTVSSSIRNEWARVSFSRSWNCTSRFGECNFAFWKTHKCKLIPNCTRKTVWLPINNINMKKFASRMFWTLLTLNCLLSFVRAESGKNCAIITPSRARAWFENKRFDWLSVNFFVHWPIRMLALLPFLHSITSFLHCVKEKLHCSQPIRIE